MSAYATGLWPQWVVLRPSTIRPLAFRPEVADRPKAAARDPARMRTLIRESVANSPAVIVVAGLVATRDALDATTTVPIVVATSSDLVDAGIVKSLAHPGGNITGVSDLTDETTLKRLELLKVALPNASRVAQHKTLAESAQCLLHPLQFGWMMRVEPSTNLLFIYLERPCESCLGLGASQGRGLLSQRI